MTEKIDAYSHFMLSEAFDWFERRTGQEFPRKPFHLRHDVMWQVDARIALMDELGVDRHVLVSAPNIFIHDEVATSPALATEVARVANTAMAGIVADHPDRFSGVAFLPVVSGANMAAELEHAVRELGLVGGVVFVGPRSLALDSPEFNELYDTAAELDVPIWVHPSRAQGEADVAGESESKYRYYTMFGFVSDDSLAACRIVFSGAFARNPGLKVILHHSGGMIPFFHGRIEATLASFGEMDHVPLDDFRRFHVDTALMAVDPLALGVVVQYFGPDRVLFGSDCPQDHDGVWHARTTDALVAAVDVTPEVRQQIYSGNARRVLKLGAA